MSLDFTQVVATPRSLKLGDTTYRFTPFRIREWSELQRWIHDQHIAVQKKIFADQPPEVVERSLARLQQALPSITPLSAEGQVQLRTPEGAMFMAFLSLRPEHPDITMEAVEKIMFGAAVDPEVVAQFIAETNRTADPKANPATQAKAAARRRGKATARS